MPRNFFLNQPLQRKALKKRGLKKGSIEAKLGCFSLKVGKSKLLRKYNLQKQKDIKPFKWIYNKSFI